MALERLKSGSRDAIRLTPEMVGQFSASMREHLASGDIAFRKAYLGSLVDRVEVDDREVRICGRKDVLEQLVTGGAKPAGIARKAVRSFIPNWLPFLDTYRTFLVSGAPLQWPEVDLRQPVVLGPG